MNATPTSPIEEINDNSGSNSDSNRDDVSEYYEPISVIEDEDQQVLDDRLNSDKEHHHPNLLSNGYINRVENGISYLHVQDVATEQEAAEERMKEASDNALRRAFMEEEIRRNTPLMAETLRESEKHCVGFRLADSLLIWLIKFPRIDVENAKWFFVLSFSYKYNQSDRLGKTGTSIEQTNMLVLELNDSPKVDSS